MSSASSTPSPPAVRWNERVQPWAAALASALLHLLVLLLLLHSTPPVVTTPQGTAGGGRVKVDFVGEAPPSPTPARQPPGPKQDDARKKPARPTARRQADARKPVPEARYIEPPAEPAPAQTRSDEPPAPEPAQASAASPPGGMQRRSQAWTGRPPGWLPRETSPDDGRASGPVNRNGYRNDVAAGEPAMEVGGYQIIYDLLGEARLRTWMEQGMKELSIPLPGTTYLMVCPAEVALRRGSSKCRLLPPDAPELQSIGDARQVVTVMYVYRRGELVWRGPGPYR